jgi:hypothetical protein
MRANSHPHYVVQYCSTRTRTPTRTRTRTGRGKSYAFGRSAGTTRTLGCHRKWPMYCEMKCRLKISKLTAFLSPLHCEKGSGGATHPTHNRSLETPLALVGSNNSSNNNKPHSSSLLLLPPGCAMGAFGLDLLLLQDACRGRCYSHHRRRSDHGLRSCF